MAQTNIDWGRPEHGDKLYVSHWRGIGNFVIMWDDERCGYSIGADFRMENGDLDFRELSFLSESEVDEDRFLVKTTQKDDRRNNHG